MTVIYESPDHGKTTYARTVNDYSHRWPVAPPRRALRGRASSLADAAERFGGLERPQPAPAATPTGAKR